MNDMKLIRTMEEMSITAWPSFQQVLMDGWMLRFANGYSTRSNSVQSIYPCSDDVVEKIRCCEALYASANLPAAFKISPLSQPPQLDSILESMGYRQHHRTSVQVLGTLPESTVGDERSDIRNTPLGEWFDAFFAISAASTEKMQNHARIVGKIPMPMCAMVTKHGGQPAACARGVLQGEYVGLYDVCTLPSARRMGLATQIIRDILSWASARGATRAYLQVMEDNSAAVALYSKLGFRHVYSYWYRVKDAGPSFVIVF
jgi:GNAT superfamily N-acetyltransferase